MADLDYDKLGDAVARALKRGGGGFNPGGNNTGGGSGSLDLAKFGESVKENLKTGADGFVDAAKTSVSTFQGLSKSGANFSNDIIGMNVAAAQSRLSLADFANVIANNGKNMAGLGGSVTRGAEAFGKLSKSFFDSNAGNELQQMGYTAKEVNEVLALQASTSRYTMGVEGTAGAKARESAAMLAKEMDAIAKLTGKSKEEQMEAAKKRSTDGQIEAKLRLIGIEQGADAEAKAREGFQKQFAAAEARGMGQMAKEMFATGTVTSEEAATQYALLGEAAQKTGEQMSHLSKGNIAAADAANKEAEAANAKNQRDPTLLRMAAMGDAAGSVGTILKKSTEDNMALHDSVMGLVKGNTNLLKSQDDYAKALTTIRTDIAASQKGINAQGKQVSGATQGVVATQIAGQNLGAGVASAVETENKKGESIAGSARRLGAGVADAEQRMAGPGGNLSTKIENAAKLGQNPQAEPAPTGNRVQDEANRQQGGSTVDRTIGSIIAKSSDVANMTVTGTLKVLGKTNIAANAEGGYVSQPTLSTLAEEGPEFVLNQGQMKDTIAAAGMSGVKNILGKLPTPTEGKGGIDLSGISKAISTSISSVAKTPAAAKSAAPMPAVVEQSMSMGKMTLKDDQRKVFDEMMSMNGKQANEKLASLKAEETASKAANKAAYTARDAIEEKYEAEGKSIKDMSAEDKKRFDELTKQMNESFDNTRKIESAVDAASKAEDTRQSLQKMGYEIGIKQEEDKAKIIEETSEKIKADIKEALPVKDVESAAEKTKTVLTAHQETTLKYAYQDTEGKKMQLDNQKNLVKGELNSIAEKNKQIEDIQKAADGQELTNREKNRIERLQKEIEAGKETLKIRQDDLEVYQNLDKLSGERGLKEKQDAAKKTAEINNQAMLDKLKVDVAAGATTTQELTVNGKSVDPAGDEGKATLAQMDKAKADMQETMGSMIKEMPKAMSEDKQEAKQIPNVPKASSIGIDLNAINLPGFGAQMKNNAASVPAAVNKTSEKQASPGKKINPETGEEYTPVSDAKPKEEKPAQRGGKTAALEDVVKGLDMLNITMNKLLSQSDDLGRKQISAMEKNPKNMYS